MSLQEQLTNDMKAAMKARDTIRVDTIRMIRAQIKDTQIASGQELDDGRIIQVLNNAAKKRREAIALYQQSGRIDLVEKETEELGIISAYLPAQLSRVEVEDIVKNIITEIGATAVGDFGKVMGTAMQELKGRADGKMVQEIVRESLT